MLNKNLPRFIIDLESKLRSEKMYIHFKSLPEPDIKSTESEVQTEDLNNVAYNCKKKTSSKKKPIENNSRLFQEAKRVTQLHLLSKEIFLIQNEIFELAGITSGSKQVKIKKYLLNNSWYKEHRLPKGKNYMNILEPLPLAYKVCDISEKALSSKGGYLHQFCCHRIKDYFKPKYYQIKIEYFLSNNKAVDLVLKSNSELIFIEIGISEPVEKELNNLINDLSTDLKPTKVIMACRDKKYKIKLEKLISTEKSLNAYEGQIEVVLAGNFIQIIK